MKKRNRTCGLAQIIIIGFMAGRTLALAQIARAATVADAIEATIALGVQGQEFLWSPNHKAVAVVLARGNVQRNGTEFRILGCESRVQPSCEKLDTLATLFSTSTGGLTTLLQKVRWTDEKTLVFLWDGGDALGSQLYQLDVPTGRLAQLTKHPTPVWDYDISEGGRRFVFVAKAPRDTAKIKEMALRGFVVGDQGLTPLLRGDLDGWPWQTGVRHDFFVQTERDGSPQRVGNEARSWSRVPSPPVLSPDGKYAVTTRSVYVLPSEWAVYVEAFKRANKPYEAEALRLALEGMPGHLVVQYALIDLEHHTIRSLWDAPTVAGYPYFGGQVIAPIWSTDSKSVALGPTLLPLSQQREPGVEDSVAVVDIETGSVAQLPVPVTPKLRYGPRHWTGEGKLVLEGTDSTQIAFERRASGKWVRAPLPAASGPGQVDFDLFISQGLNASPVVVRRDLTSSRETVLLDLNPQLKNVTLGHVELFHWRSSNGQPWTGQLYHPVGEVSGHRYPLVIQTHGYGASDRDRFELSGASTTMFAAQPLANQGIMVLQLGASDSSRVDRSPAEAAEHVAGYTSAIDALDAAGLIDRNRVGIIGWSYTGWTVSYTLTHTDYARYPFTAAIVGDNIDCGYFQRIMFAESARNSNDACVGVPPIGPGLQAWLKEAPGFNTDKIHTPVRFEADDDASAVEDDWEIFQLLRFQHKPVEMVAIPNYQHGEHSLQNPQQRLASQGGTVDWFVFWLKNEEDPDPAKAEQYHRWRGLRKLQEQDSTEYRQAAPPPPLKPVKALVGNR